jgi:hypothetical protein
MILNLHENFLENSVETEKVNVNCGHNATALVVRRGWEVGDLLIARETSGAFQILSILNSPYF